MINKKGKTVEKELKWTTMESSLTNVTIPVARNSLKAFYAGPSSVVSGIADLMPLLVASPSSNGTTAVGSYNVGIGTAYTGYSSLKYGFVLTSETESSFTLKQTYGEDYETTKTIKFYYAVEE